MSLATQATPFNRSQITQYRHWYERLPYTALDASLSPAGTDIFSDISIADVTSGQKIAGFSDLAATQTANVSLVLNQPKRQTVFQTQALNPGLIPSVGDDRDTLWSTGDLALAWNNASGTAPTTIQQANFMGTLKTMTTWEKVQSVGVQGFGWTEMDDQLYSLMAHKPKRPMTLREALRLSFEDQIVDSEWKTYVFPTTTGLSPIGPFQPPSGEIFVVHTVAAAIPSGSAGNLIQLTIFRDSQQALDTLLIDNTAGLQYPWHPWIQASRQLGFNLSAVTATSNVTLRLGWWRIRHTPLIQALNGTMAYARLTGSDKTLFERIQSGVVLV